MLPAAPPPAPEPASLRRPVFEPLPQKRGAAQPPPPSEALPPPPPPPEETGNTQPPEERPRTRAPAWADENATRAAPSEEPRPEGRGRTLSRETRLPPEERGATRSRPPRMDLHTMGTVPYTDGPPGAQDSPDEEDDESTQQDSLSSQGPRPRPRSTSSERVSRHGGSRPPPRRAPTPPPEEEESSPEVVTHQVRAFRAPDEEPEDTNETRLPDSEEGALSITTPGAPSLPKRRGGGLMIVLAVLALLIIGGGAAVALGLDGGRVSGLWATLAPQLPGAAEPVKPPTPAEPTGVTPAPVPPQPATGTPVPEPTAKAEPTPAPPTPAEPETPPGAGTPSPTGAEALALKNSPPEEPEPEAVSAVTPPEEEEEEVAPAIRKPSRPTPIKRTRREPKPTGEDTAPSDWAPVEAKEEKPEPAATESPSAGAGVLTLVTDPYAKVYLGKRYLGDTPLFKISMPAGKHSLRLVGPDGQKLQLPVEIKANETTAVRIELDSLARE